MLTTGSEKNSVGCNCVGVTEAYLNYLRVSLFTENRTCEPNYKRLMQECPSEIFDSDECTDEEGIQEPIRSDKTVETQNQLVDPGSKFNNDIYISPICVTHARAMEGWYCSCRNEEDDYGNARNMTESEEMA